MQNPPEQTCQRRFDFTAYLDDHIHADQKAQLEQHLCVCDDCFETLIDVLNQELNQAGNWILQPAAPHE
jgi:anti-sigma factor RsiW